MINSVSPAILILSILCEREHLWSILDLSYTAIKRQSQSNSTYTPSISTNQKKAINLEKMDTTKRNSSEVLINKLVEIWEECGHVEVYFHSHSQQWRCQTCVLILSSHYSSRSGAVWFTTVKHSNRIFFKARSGSIRFYFMWQLRLSQWRDNSTNNLHIKTILISTK